MLPQGAAIIYPEGAVRYAKVLSSKHAVHVHLQGVGIGNWSPKLPHDKRWLLLLAGYTTGFNKPGLKTYLSLVWKVRLAQANLPSVYIPAGLKRVALSSFAVDVGLSIVACAPSCGRSGLAASCG